MSNNSKTQLGSLVNIHVKYQDHRDSEMFNQVLLLKSKVFYNQTFEDIDEILKELKLRGLSFIANKEDVYYWDYQTSTMSKCYNSQQDRYEVQYISSQSFLRTKNFPQLTLIINQSEEKSSYDQNQIQTITYQSQEGLYNTQENFFNSSSSEIQLFDYQIEETNQIFDNAICKKYQAETSDEFHESADLNFEVNSQQSTQKSSLEDQQEQKHLHKSKGRERTISEVSQLLREWKKLKNYRNIPLKRGALRLGVPLKSLEEYYQDFKLATYYNFDFVKNFHGKIGLLRQFCRTYKGKPERIPKLLQKQIDSQVLRSLEEEHQSI